MIIKGLKIGSAGSGKIRTCWDLTLTVGIPFSRWGAEPFVTSPIPFPADKIEAMHSETKSCASQAIDRLHSYELAQEWNRELDHDPTLNRARIAAREGFSRARVTQIMDLLHLAAPIQNDLRSLQAASRIRLIPERRLRELVRCADEATQVQRWREMLHQLGDPGGD